MRLNKLILTNRNILTESNDYFVRIHLKTKRNNW